MHQRFLTMSVDASHEASILVALSAAGIAATSNPSLASGSPRNLGYSAITLANASDYDRAVTIVAGLQRTPIAFPSHGQGHQTFPAGRNYRCHCRRRDARA